MKILIVDDEILARDRLHDLVMELYPDAILIEATNGIEALKKITEQSPDIVLLDIRMPGMDGLEVANHVLQIEKQPAIVFTTAYQDHALSAFDANAIDYLLKPIRKERLNTAIGRAVSVSKAKLSAINETDGASSKRTNLSVMIKGNLQLIPVENIYYLKAEQKYVTAAWPGKEILLDESLVSLENEFSDHFIRIHRNALVATQYIESLIKSKDGQQLIKLENMSIELTVSRRHLQEVKKAFKLR